MSKYLSTKEKDALLIFLNKVNKRFGLYLDSVQGFNLNVKELERIQKAGYVKLSIDEFDEKPYIRGDGPPSIIQEEWEKRELHRMTQGEFKKNNSKGGFNHKKALADCLCGIFDEWTTFKRDVLIKKGAMKDGELIPLLDYLKKIRNRLTHSDQKSAQRKINRFDMQYIDYTLPGFEEGISIVLSSQDLKAIIRELRLSIINIKK